MSTLAPVKLSRLRTAGAFEDRLRKLGLSLPLDRELVSGGVEGPLARPLRVGGRTIGNRWAILPMEGWDGDAEGRPTERVRRRWRRFGASGAKLIWGGEAVAVRHDGRANPRQLRIGDDTAGALAALRQELVESHRDAHGSADDLRVGLQLTHSGRFARPDGRPRPRVAYRHPWLDRRTGVTSDDSVLSDAELDGLAGDFVAAARHAREAGFDFVDVKHCHGYLGHELLSAVERTGPYGGSLEGRSRFLERVVAGIRRDAPGLDVAVRLSAFDTAPFRPGADGRGESEARGGRPYPYAFGGDGTGSGIDLREPHALLERLAAWGVTLVCVTAGSPYTNPHVQRPAWYPPSDGYLPPGDPLVGVERLVRVAAELKRAHPELVIVGSGYSYLQEWLPHVAQAVVREGGADLVGIGRMALAYPGLPGDVLAEGKLARRRVCRTFSDCTTAPRHGLVSGCYPLDPGYRSLPERQQLEEAKRRDRAAGADGAKARA